MSEEADGGSNGFLGFLASKLGGPKWAGPLLVSLVGFGFWVHHEKEDLVDRINNTRIDVGHDIGALKNDFSKDRQATSIELTKIRHSIEVLANKSPNKDLVNQMLSERISPIEKRLGDVQNKVEQQASLVRVFNPNRILAVVRSEVGIAQTNKNYGIAERALVDLRNAVLTVPQDTAGFWYTAQILLNYASDALIASGKIPDPAKVAHPCPGLTGGPGVNLNGNSYEGPLQISKCIVDLDSEMFVGTIFKDCIIRSRGGAFILRGVIFINCRFVLDLPEEPQRKNEKRFLEALLSAPTLSNVKATNG